MTEKRATAFEREKGRQILREKKEGRFFWEKRRRLLREKRTADFERKKGRQRLREEREGRF